MDYCSTCLSTDRSMKLIKDLRKIIPILQTLELKLHASIQFNYFKEYICWECEARFNNIIKFNDQIAEAKKKMAKWHKNKGSPSIIKRNPLSPLSKLTISAMEIHDRAFDTTGNDVSEEPELSTEIMEDSNEPIEEEEGGQTESDEDDFSLLIVNNEDSIENTSSYEYEPDPIDLTDDKEMQLNKDEEIFHVTKMSTAEMNECREMDRNATVYKRCLYKCLMCITGYYKEDKFDSHLRLRHDLYYHGRCRKYKCTICETRFTRKDLMQVHYERHFRKYSCKLCEFTHHKLGTMFLHRIKEHKQMTSYACHVCSMEFDRSYALNWHMKSHKEKLKRKMPTARFKKSMHPTNLRIL